MSMLTWLYNHLPNAINKKGAYFVSKQKGATNRRRDNTEKQMKQAFKAQNTEPVQLEIKPQKKVGTEISRRMTKVW